MWLLFAAGSAFFAGVTAVLAKCGIQKTDSTVATAIRGPASLTFPAAMSGYLSAFCNSGTAEGVTLENLKFPLEHSTLTSSFPLGVSNQFLGQSARVSVEKGSLLLIWEDKGDFYSLLPQLWLR